MKGPDGRAVVRPADRAAWRRWLERNHSTSHGIWLALPGKEDGRLTYEDAVEEALCFGWIDSKGSKLEDGRAILTFSPRRRGSVWARSNKDRVVRLIRRGLMTEAGRAVIERAKADGSWTAMDAVEALEVPDDLRAALRKNRAAARHFEAFPPSAKKQILWWIVSAKRPETRAKRVAETARLAAKNVRANQPSP